MPAPGGGVWHRVGVVLLLISPGLWVIGVVGLGVALHMEVQFIPLLAAAPAVSCTGTERHQSVIFGCVCALIALVPFGSQPAALGERIGTAAAVLAVLFVSCLAVHRRLRVQRAYDEVRRIAEVTQRVLLRPIPERIGPVAAAVEYLSAATGARVGGDFYEVIDTPYGVRAILGDVRGSGLGAVSGAAALLGAFREAGAVEPTLEAVAVRLDAALTRHTTGARRAELSVGQRDEFDASGWGHGTRETRSEVEVSVRTGNAGDEVQLSVEDFATAVLVQVPYEGRVLGGSAAAGLDGADVGPVGAEGGGDGSWAGAGIGIGAGTDVERWHGNGANEARLVVCGHPAPYLIRGDQTLPVSPERPTLPLGLGSLLDEPYAATSSVVPFEPGDALVFYTDGVSDARTRSGEFFRLEELLCGLARFSFSSHDGREGLASRAPRSVAAIVRSRLLEHVHRQLNDDAALLVLGRLGADA